MKVKTKDSSPSLFRLMVFIFLMTFVTELAMALTLMEYYNLLPSEIDGYKKAAKPEIYNQNNLYEYIDGGAELYKAYDFKELLALKYKDEADSEIIVDFFDMGSPANAFGVFSYTRESEDQALGQGSEYNSGLLTFWKGSYYVSILAYPETEKKKQTVLKLGQLLAEAITQKGELPAVISLLPSGKLVPESIRFFHHYVPLNNHYFIANENIMDIDAETQVVLASYKETAGTFYLLLLLFPESQQAREAQANFLKHRFPNAKDGLAQLPDGKWSGCRLKDRLLAIVLNAPAKDVVDSYLGLVTEKTP